MQSVSRLGTRNDGSISNDVRNVSIRTRERIHCACTDSRGSSGYSNSQFSATRRSRTEAGKSDLPIKFIIEICFSRKSEIKLYNYRLFRLPKCSQT